MRIVAVIALSGLLMGCQTVSERVAAKRDVADDAKCQNFGAVKGTQAYMSCRLALEHDRSAVRMSREFGQGNGLTDLINGN